MFLKAVVVVTALLSLLGWQVLGDSVPPEYYAPAELTAFLQSAFQSSEVDADPRRVEVVGTTLVVTPSPLPAAIYDRTKEAFVWRRFTSVVLTVDSARFYEQPKNELMFLLSASNVTYEEQLPGDVFGPPQTDYDLNWGYMTISVLNSTVLAAPAACPASYSRNLTADGRTVFTFFNYLDTATYLLWDAISLRLRPSLLFAPAQCINGGTCKRVGCDCPTGFDGPRCELPIAGASSSSPGSGSSTLTGTGSGAPPSSTGSAPTAAGATGTGSTSPSSTAPASTATPTASLTGGSSSVASALSSPTSTLASASASAANSTGAQQPVGGGGGGGSGSERLPGGVIALLVLLPVAAVGALCCTKPGRVLRERLCMRKHASMTTHDPDESSGVREPSVELPTTGEP